MACKWGPIVDRTEDYIKQKVYFSCRTDGTYTENDNLWKRFAGFLVVAVIGNLILIVKMRIIDIPNNGVIFDQELNHIFLQQNFKKCPFLTVKQIIIHPGEINVVKKSIFRSKMDSNAHRFINCLYMEFRQAYVCPK